MTGLSCNVLNMLGPSKIRLINRHQLFADHFCIKSKAAFLQIVGLFMYFLNMYSLFNLISCVAELQAREDRVSLEQYSVKQFLSKIKSKL